MKTILTDGMKAIDLNSDDPSIWTFFSGAPESTQNTLYAQVSAAFRAFNLKANTVGNMPFALYTENGDEFDNSATWQNKVGFLPNPSELFRLNTLSYMATNTIYNVRTSDALGYKVKGLYHAVATNFTPYTYPMTGAIDYIERRVGASIERYQPVDKRLVRMWRLDHTTEVLPSPNTEARAIMNAAGEIYYADLWIKHFYERGGVAPTLVMMKGAIAPEKRDSEEDTWGNWLLKLGRRFAKAVRVVNADALDVKQFGSSVTDLKNNEVYMRAITNIAMGTGMPLSLLMANSANYATAKEEKATWYDNDIIPFCNWQAYGYNEQVFKPLGLSLQFHPETLDPQQEDETARSAAVNQFMDFLSKCPTYDVFIGTCETFGYELSDSLVKAAETYYSDKEALAEETRRQMQGAGVVLSPDGKPIAQAQPEPDEDEEEPEAQPAKWIPNIDQIRELQRWQELAFRKFKRDESLAFEWRNDTLPEEVYKAISTNLPNAKEESAIKQVFDVAEIIAAPVEVKVENDVFELAKSINRLADIEAQKLGYSKFTLTNNLVNDVETQKAE